MIEWMIGLALAAPQQPPTSFLADIPCVLTANDAGLGKELGYLSRPGTMIKLLKNELPFYCRSAMFPGNIPEIAAFSRGVAAIPLELVPIGGENKAVGNLEATDYTFLAYSVTGQTQGTDGSIYSTEPNAKGCLFAVLGGQDVPNEFKGVVHKLRDADVTGVDDAIGLDTYAFAGLLDGIDDGEVDFYFSVTGTTKNFIPGGQSSSIYRIKYRAGVWEPIETMWTATDLNLHIDDEIDALTVEPYEDDEGTLRYRVLLSIAKPVNRMPSLLKELWVYWELPGGEVHTGPYFATGGTALYVEANLDLDSTSDGVDAVCSEDPPAAEPGADPSERTRKRFQLHLWARAQDQMQPSDPNAQTDCHSIFKKVNGDRRRIFRMNLRLLQQPVGNPIIEFQTSPNKNTWVTVGTRVYPSGLAPRVSVSWPANAIPVISHFFARARITYPNGVVKLSHTLVGFY